MQNYVGGHNINLENIKMDSDNAKAFREYTQGVGNIVTSILIVVIILFAINLGGYMGKETINVVFTDCASINKTKVDTITINNLDMEKMVNYSEYVNQFNQCKHMNITINRNPLKKE
jgi:hypothetical protein